MIVLDEPNTGSMILLLIESTRGGILLHHGNDTYARAPL